MFPFFLINLLRYHMTCEDLSCTILSSTPLGDKKYTPQGITWIDNKIIFSNTWKNTKSRVYLFDPKTLTEISYFDMPSEAVHTSGFCIVGGYLWGVDYKSNYAYKIDYKKSFEEKKCYVLGKFHTGLKGTSAACTIEYESKELLLISDFMNTRKVIAVDTEAALKTGSAKGNIVGYYKNDGFSQGLEWDGTYLYETENKMPYSVFNIIDLDKAFKSHKLKDGLIKQYKLNVKGIEDLAFDGEKFWSSDEVIFKFLTITVPKE